LLAYVDRELTLRKERKVKNHLGVCWSCRARLGELDSGAQNFARAFSDQTFPGPHRVSRARDAIFDRVRLWEQERSPAPAIPLVQHWRRRLVLPAAVAAVLVAGISLFRLATPEQMPSPETVLARAQETEAQLYQEPIHQTFRVEVMQEKPLSEHRASRLEVWFDNSQGRFASRWKETDGSLKYGLWRPDQGQEYIYDPLAEKRPDRAVSLFELSEVDLEQLETGFMRWLERRRWRPISFVSELARFAGEDGIILRVRRIEANGRETYQLSAQRQVGRTSVEIAVEVDGETFEPRLQRVRIETPDRVVALRLLPEQIESIPSSSLLPAVFEPDVPLKAAERRLSGLRTQQAPAANLPAGDLAAKFPTAAELDATEMEAHYALHLAGACLGEPIEIVRETPGRLIVRGVAHSAGRQSELLAALGELQGPPWLQLSIQTVESAIAANREAGQQPVRVSGPASPAESLPSPSYSVQVSSDRLSLQDQLERHFAREGENGGSRSLNAFTRQAVSQSQAAMDHAWALRRLAERYGSDQTAQSLPRSRWLLQVMVREHLAEFTNQARMTRELLQPVLASISKDAPGAGRDTEQRVMSVPAGPSPGGDWKDRVLRAFGSTEELHRAVLGLFAGASLPVEVDAGQNRVRVKTAEETVNAVLGSLPRLESEIADAQEQVARDFSSGRPLAARKDAGR